MALLISCGGCWESAVLISSGAAGALTATEIVRQQKEVAQANIDLMEQDLLDIEEKIAVEKDEAKKAELQKTRDNIKTVLLDLETQKAVITEFEKSLGTDWGKPVAVVGTISSIILAYLADRERRKKNKTTTALTEVVVGGQEFKRTLKESSTAVTDATMKIFKDAMDNKQSAETKKTIAIIKA